MRRTGNLVSLTELVSAPVCDSRGDVVGVIANLVLDTDRNRIAYARLEVAAAGNGDARIATVPWSAISLGTGGDAALKVAVRKATLEKIARPRRAD